MTKQPYKIPCSDLLPVNLAHSVMAASGGANGIVDDNTVIDFTTDDSFWTL